MRRSEFLQNSAMLLAGGLLTDSARFIHEDAKSKVRFAFMSDIHVKPDVVAEAGMANALHHIQKLRPGVDFIINGGDAIMDALDADKQKTSAQFDLYNTIVKKENNLPIYHCIGNHDVWGWFIKNNKPDNDRLYGKMWAIEAFKMSKRYYSFSKGKWHFIVLDSTQLNPDGGYIAYLDPEQLTWVQQELETHAKEKYICFISHIPILSICAGLFFDKTESNGDLKIQRNLMHTDFISLDKTFQKYSNVKVCLSGHIHMQDEVHYRGVKYYCNGAISGNWWKGAYRNFNPAYAVIELYNDGTSSRKMIEY